MADRLSDILGRLGVPLTQARALDLLARLCGQPDWGRMRDGLVRLEAAQVPIADHAISLILRLNERDPVLTARAVEAVWGAHLTATERADPGLAAARDWLRAATLAAHAWAAAERAPLTPDILLCALVAGEAGAPLPTGRVRPQGALMPRLGGPGPDKRPVGFGPGRGPARDAGVRPGRADAGRTAAGPVQDRGADPDAAHAAAPARADRRGAHGAGHR